MTFTVYIHSSELDDLLLLSSIDYYFDRGATTILYQGSLSSEQMDYFSEVIESGNLKYSIQGAPSGINSLLITSSNEFVWPLSGDISERIGEETLSTGELKTVEFLGVDSQENPLSITTRSTDLSEGKLSDLIVFKYKIGERDLDSTIEDVRLREYFVDMAARGGARLPISKVKTIVVDYYYFLSKARDFIQFSIDLEERESDSQPTLIVHAPLITSEQIEQDFSLAFSADDLARLDKIEVVVATSTNGAMDTVAQENLELIGRFGVVSHEQLVMLSEMELDYDKLLSTQWI